MLGYVHSMEDNAMQFMPVLSELRIRKAILVDNWMVVMSLWFAELYPEKCKRFTEFNGKSR
jgi:hypothetical protein